MKKARALLQPPDMEFRILGPLEVRDGEREVSLGGGRQRALLALLLLHAGEPVATDRLVEELWGDGAPPSAPKAIQNHVSQLRRALQDGRLVTRGSAYELALQPGELDAEQFEALLERGRAARGDRDPAAAAPILREALGLWRGSPLADVSLESFSARSEIGRLEERHLVAVEERIEADLALGGHADLVGELEALIAQHPLRERLRGQLMLALYRSGRQAEALHAYQETRRTLVEELGIEPGQALQRLHTRMLQ